MSGVLLQGYRWQFLWFRRSNTLPSVIQSSGVAQAPFSTLIWKLSVSKEWQKTKKTVEWKWVILAMKTEWKLGAFQFETFDRRGRSKILQSTAEQGCFCWFFLGHVTFVTLLSFRSMSSFFDSEVAFALQVNLWCFVLLSFGCDDHEVLPSNL